MSCTYTSPKGSNVSITQLSEEVVAQNGKYQNHMSTSAALSYLRGEWIIPHNADIHITFHEDSTFIFHDYNSQKDTMEILIGTYSLHKNRLILKYSDRPQQTFLYHFGRYDDKCYIKKGSYYFVKQ